MPRQKLIPVYNRTMRKIADKMTSRPKSSNRNDILEWLHYIGLVDNYIKKLEYDSVPPETVQDEIQDIWLEICELSQEKWDYLYQQSATAIKAYISGLIYRNIHSCTSKLYNKYKRLDNLCIHISDESWEVFNETGIMQPTMEDYSTKESEIDKMKRYLETNKIDELFNEQETRKTRKTKKD